MAIIGAGEHLFSYLPMNVPMLSLYSHDEEIGRMGIMEQNLYSSPLDLLLS
jgi:hypothetical protein